MIQQRDEIRYIILVKNNKSEIQFKELEPLPETEHRLTVIDIPEPRTNVEIQSIKVIAPSPQLALLDTNSEDVKLPDEKLQEEDLTEIEEETQQERTQIKSQMVPINLEGFPKEMIKDSKLIIKGKELSRLIAKFYRLECNLCKRKFRKFSAMINHFKNEHSTKGFVNCCGLKIVKIRQIALHMARHIQPDAFKCPKCEKLLTCPKILQFHIQNHLPESERTLKCPEPGCNRRFSYQSALVTHSVSHLPEEERTTFGCQTCGRKFSTSGRLSAHINVVHMKNSLKKEFSCEICSKNFLCKSNLAYHVTTHKNFEFQVQCLICNKWLKNKICLRKHMAIHSDIRHFCNLCEYSAVNKQCLINHIKTQHSDSKPHSCEVDKILFRPSKHFHHFTFFSFLDLFKIV
jgi:hypothetical protein